MEIGVEIPLKQICLKRVPKPERASLDLPIKLLFPSVASKVKEKLFLKKSLKELLSATCRSRNYIFRSAYSIEDVGAEDLEEKRWAKHHNYLNFSKMVEEKVKCTLAFEKPNI